jgi:hypothetical protein
MERQRRCKDASTTSDEHKCRPRIYSRLRRTPKRSRTDWKCTKTERFKPKRRWRQGASLSFSSRITRTEWLTLPVEALVERRLLSMSLSQLERQCTNNTVHYVLNQEDSKDQLLTSNELRRLLSKTPKFLPTPNSETSGTKLYRK